jgi:hypothetical protein
MMVDRRICRPTLLQMFKAYQNRRNAAIEAGFDKFFRRFQCPDGSNFLKGGS